MARTKLQGQEDMGRISDPMSGKSLWQTQRELTGQRASRLLPALPTSHPSSSGLPLEKHLRPGTDGCSMCLCSRKGTSLLFCILVFGFVFQEGQGKCICLLKLL